MALIRTGMRFEITARIQLANESNKALVSWIGLGYGYLLSAGFADAAG